MDWAVADQVRTIIAEQLGIPREDVADAATLKSLSADNKTFPNCSSNSRRNSGSKFRGKRLPP